MDTLEGQKLPVPHCIRNTHGWEINSEVWEASKGFKCVDVQNKRTFGMEDIAELLSSLTDVCDDCVDYDTWVVESIEIIGLCTDICVISNALILKASYPDIPITVYADSCAGVTPAKHEAALEVMRSCQIEVV
jgi:nicotinamidase-related amidase